MTGIPLSRGDKEKKTLKRRLARLPLAAVAVCAAAVLGGCGGSAQEPETMPTPKTTGFPAVKGRTLDQLAGAIEQSELVASPAQLVFDAGVNRYALSVFTKDKEQVTDAQVALYFAKGKDGKAAGPFPASAESLRTPPSFRAQTTSRDPSAATVVYVAPEVNFTAAGRWRALAVFRTPKGLQGTLLPSADVGRFPEIPNHGDEAPRVHTATVEDVKGELAMIDTRVPPDQMHKLDFADVVGNKPVVLLFATPQFCQSRTCGPVVEIVEQVRQEISEESGEDIAFIHQEVYNDNDPTKGLEQPLRAFHLESEPWLFVIGRDGKVSSRIEGAFSSEELRQAIERVARR